MTVEIGYALFSAAFAAAVVFGAVTGPVLVFGLSRPISTVLIYTGVALALVVFAVRVASVLLRFSAAGQPSQPGRTNPDS